MPPARRAPAARALAVAMLAALAVANVLIVTAGAVGVSPDSVAYLAAARSILDGRGLAAPGWDGRLAPLTHYPPLFPLVLAILGRAGIDGLTAARTLNALLLGATVLLVALAINRFRGGLGRAALLGAAFTAVSVDLLGTYAMAWSEPLFIVLGLAGFCLLDAALESGRTPTLVLAAVVVALASLDRYAGIALIVAGTAALLFASPRPDGGRGRRAAGFAIVSATPLLLWLARNLVVTEDAVDRRVVFHPVQAGQLQSGLLTTASWILPGAASLVGKPAAVLLAAGVIAAAAAALRVAGVVRAAGAPGGRGSTLARTGVCFVASYLGVLVFTLTFLEADSTFDPRIMSPLFVTIVIVLFDRLRQLEESPPGLPAPANRTILAICSLLLGLHGVAVTRAAIDMQRHGRGYTDSTWGRSETLARVRELPAETPIYSNRPDAIRFLAGRPAAGVPRKRDLHTAESRPTYPAELDLFRDRVRAERAVVVAFTLDPWVAGYYPSVGELQTVLGLAPLFHGADGAIYGVVAR